MKRGKGRCALRNGPFCMAKHPVTARQAGRSASLPAPRGQPAGSQAVGAGGAERHRVAKTYYNAR